MALGVTDQAEILAILVGDIHEAGWVGYISSDLAINLDELLLANRLHLVPH